MRNLIAYKKLARQIIFASSLLGLAACQRAGLNVESAEFQTQTQSIVTKYASNIRLAKMRASIGGVTSTVTATTPTTYTYPTTSYSIPTGIGTNVNLAQYATYCENQLNQVQESAANFGAIMGGLAQCLNTIINYNNSLLAYTYRSMTPTAQQNWQYLLNPNATTSASTVPSLGNFAASGGINSIYETE